MSAGWPERKRVMSGSGPFSPIFQGVWQSLQPPPVTRYFPRGTGGFAAFAAGFPVAAAAAGAAGFLAAGAAAACPRATSADPVPKAIAPTRTVIATPSRARICALLMVVVPAVPVT